MQPHFTRAVTLKKLAEYLGVTLPTLYAESKRGKLIISKIGRRSIILPNHAEQYLQGLQKKEAA